MHRFRVQLILALIASVTVVSVASTYFDVLRHRHVLREELQARTKWMGMSLEPNVELALALGNPAGLPDLAQTLRAGTGSLGLAIFDPHGRLLACSGPPELMNALSHSLVQKSLEKGAIESRFSHSGGWQWLEEALPLHQGSQLAGAMTVAVDARYIHVETTDLWMQSFWRILALVVLIVLITFAMVRWFLMRPMKRVTERLRHLRTGHSGGSSSPGTADLGLFPPLAREVETMAESLIAARAAAEAEARLREAGESLWTAERLAVRIRNRSGSSRIFLVSNREPYMHVHKGREIAWVVPPSGLVTALEPVVQACDGVWVASGSGDADRQTVDSFDRLRVPPDEPRYTLRRVWLTPEEEEKYYDGFSNEGLWPLCHIAHTRPTFREGDWECYRRVNRHFASALVEEMEGSEDPVVFVQDFHFALLPRMVKQERPDARVAIFWHIPWPNPETFGICPWQAELIDGILGADLIGFHVPLHCHNFLGTVDRALEARTDTAHMTVRRLGHLTTVRPYPASVAFQGNPHAGASRNEAEAAETHADERDKLLSEFGARAEMLAVGVDRLDYTKGIVERLTAVEQLLEKHPFYLERFTLVQIAAPSRTRIRAYADLRLRVEEAVERINCRFQTARWRPVVLIDRQCNHQEVTRWYRAADLCLVTSLHDGMNLVAKEFVAARDDEDGVLVLSKFAGAAGELQDALIVNPYDIGSVAEAICTGLDMSRDDRRIRMQRMRRQVMEHNIYLWAANVLGDLRELRIDALEDAETNSHRMAPAPAHGIEAEVGARRTA
ncbi:MAG TPA: trehalose-6-phosphate synthase [Terracidiphilus sp.]|nr:trehalose-6-phosphate synthase [Terracidiphilus sp.]